MVVVLIIMLHERIQTQEGLNFVLSGITTAKNRATYWHIELQKTGLSTANLLTVMLSLPLVI